MKKYSLMFFVALFLTLPCLASQNIINSVIIAKSKENPSKYELSIDSTETVQYKMHNDEQGTWFELKNSTVAPNVGTIYDDVSDIDSVSVKMAGKNKVNIYLKGKNVENTELLFINSLFDTKQDQKKKIVLSNPVSDYQSTDFNDELQEDSVEWNNNAFNFSHLGLNILHKLKQGPMGIILGLLSLLAIIAIAVKSIAQKLSQDSEPLIGLNNSYVKDSTIIRDLNRTKTFQDAQAELAKAHAKYQNYLQNKYKNNVTNTKTDNIRKGIAVNQYQKATMNPYPNQTAIRINKDFTSRDTFQVPPKPMAQKPFNKQVNSELKNSYVQKGANKLNFKFKQDVKPNNLKFLESVTKIYEQSGRADLAQGLRTSISNVK